MTSPCPANVWNHTDGCTCLPNGSITAEVDLDLAATDVAEERPEWTVSKIGSREHKGKACTRCGTDYATCTDRIMGRVPGATGACCGSCAYTGTHSETQIASPYDVGSGQSRQTTEPLRELSLATDNGLAREISRNADEGRYDMEPPYQREGSLWSLDQRIALVKSWVQGIPVPPVTLNDRTSRAWAENNGGVNPLDSGTGMYGVVDGKQRIECAQAWFNSEFAVPASWFPPEEVETTVDTPDGPYVTFDGLTKPGQNFMNFKAKLPRTIAHLESVEDEAHLFLLLNGGGTQQTDESMGRAARVASGGR